MIEVLTRRSGFTEGRFGVAGVTLVKEFPVLQPDGGHRLVDLAFLHAGGSHFFELKCGWLKKGAESNIVLRVEKDLVKLHERVLPVVDTQGHWPRLRSAWCLALVRHRSLPIKEIRAAFESQTQALRMGNVEAFDLPTPNHRGPAALIAVRAG